MGAAPIVLTGITYNNIALYGVPMRKNLPVTNNERTFSPNQKLISSTDLKGKIRHCNKAFVDVSGFNREELIGQPHNIVRHPDMPPEAYAEMWGV